MSRCCAGRGTGNSCGRRTRGQAERGGLMVATQRGFGPNPGRVHELAELARELDQLRARPAAGTLKAKVSLEDLTRLVRMPRSTLHRYVTGQTLAPSE